MRVALVGGGSGGSTAPLLAVAAALRRRTDVELLYIGSANGPERALVQQAGISFVGISTGKLRRYWARENFTDLFRTFHSILYSFDIIRRFHPDVLTSAGGFVCVPPALAAWALRVPIHIHQQDVEPGLANRLISPIASRITVSFDQSRSGFPNGKTVLTGNPVRAEILGGRPEAARQTFALEPNVPVLLATGGGTGALGLNRLVAAAAPLLVEFCQVVHLCGRGKLVATTFRHPRYRQVEFVVEEMKDLLALADLVVSRAGLSTLTELGAISKPSILVPMPDSHQLHNANAFAAAGAAIVLKEKQTSATELAATIGQLLADGARLKKLGQQARSLTRLDAADAIASEVLCLAERPRSGARF